MQDFDRSSNSPDLETIIDRSSLTVAPNTSALEAIKLMSREGAGYLFVVEDLQLLGILRERDALKLSISGMDLSSLKITEVMETPAIAIEFSQIKNISTALSLLEQHQTSPLPILDDTKRLLGTISCETIIRSQQFQKQVDRNAQALELEEL